MGFFAILDKPGGQQFDVEKLDINYTLLPGVLGRYTKYCDVGIRLRTLEQAPGVSDPERLKFGVCLPFVTEASEVADVIPVIRDNPLVANLVFGNDAEAPRSQNGSAPIYHDGEKHVALTCLNLKHVNLESTDRRTGFSLWTLSSEGPVTAQQIVYLRARFRVRHPGRTWSWQNGPRRRSHAICDLRVNELRERPDILNPPDFRRHVRPVSTVNVFVATPSNLRVGRVSPEPSHVRVLEGRGWETYMQRRIGTQQSVLVITHWKQANVNDENPVRALLEVERRSPTPMRAALTAVLLTLIGLLLILPPETLRHSTAALVASNTFVYMTGLSLAGTLTVYRILVPIILNRRYKHIKQVVDWLEKKKYRIRR